MFSFSETALTPGFLVVHANLPEQLRALVVSWTKAYPLAVLETETVLVQSNGIAQWLKLALAEGLMDAGCDVIDIGMTGTEEVYFATFHLQVDGGIEVTASHNPIDYNGMKLVQSGARPISGDSGLFAIQQLDVFPIGLFFRRTDCINQ